MTTQPTRRSRKLPMIDHRRKPWHCRDCGADLSHGLSQVLHGGTKRSVHLCLKCAEKRQGIRNEYGRKQSEEA